MGGPISNRLEDLAFDKAGNLFIPDTSAHSLLKYDLEGTRLATSGHEGTGNGEYGHFSSPRGVAISSQGNVYVIDSDNGRIQKFDRDGNFLTKWAIKAVQTNQEAYPLRIAVDSRERVYLAVYFAGVEIYDSSGNYQGLLGTELAKKDELTTPRAIAVDDSDNVFVGQPFEVYKFDATGRFVTNWQIKTFDRPPTAGWLNSLDNLAVDWQGNIYVSNTNVIEKFDPAGKFLLSWTISTDEKSYSQIGGIAVDNQNQIYILNGYENQVEIYNTEGKALGEWSVGWPKWLKANQLYYYILFYLVLIGIVVLSFREKHYRKLYGLSLERIKVIPYFKENVLPKTTKVKWIQVLTVCGGLVGLILGFVNFNIVYSLGPNVNIPKALGISGWYIHGAGLAAAATFLNFAMLATAFLVAKKPKLAGILQIAGSVLLLFTIAVDPFRFVLNILPIFVGGILALRSVQEPEETLKLGTS